MACVQVEDKNAPGGERPAKGPTAQEFKFFVGDCDDVWWANQRAEGTHIDPRWSWDNASVHGGAITKEAWTKMLGPTCLEDHSGLPPYSPDMHSVIELAHARIMRPMQEWLDTKYNPGSMGMDDVLLELKAIFLRVITPDWVKNTTHRLYLDVLPAIIQAEGHYPPKSHR